MAGDRDEELYRLPLLWPNAVISASAHLLRNENAPLQGGALSLVVMGGLEPPTSAL